MLHYTKYLPFHSLDIWKRLCPSFQIKYFTKKKEEEEEEKPLDSICIKSTEESIATQGRLVVAGAEVAGT